MDPSKGMGGFQSQGDVFCNRQIRKQSGLLIDARDSQFMGEGWGEVGYPFRSDLDPAVIGLVRAGDDFDQCGFSSAIFSQQGMDFAGVQVKGNTLQGAHCAERFRDGNKIQQRGCHCSGNEPAPSADRVESKIPWQRPPIRSNELNFSTRLMDVILDSRLFWRQQ